MICIPSTVFNRSGRRNFSLAQQLQFGSRFRLNNEANESEEPKPKLVVGKQQTRHEDHHNDHNDRRPVQLRV